MKHEPCQIDSTEQLLIQQTPTELLADLDKIDQKIQTVLKQQNLLSCDIIFFKQFKLINEQAQQSTLYDIKTKLKNILDERVNLQDHPILPTHPLLPVYLIYRKIASLIDSKKINSLLMPEVMSEDTYGNLLDDLFPWQFIITEDKKSFIELVTFFNATLERIKSREIPIYQYIDVVSKFQQLTINEKNSIANLMPIVQDFFETAKKAITSTKGTLLEFLQELVSILKEGDVTSNQNYELDSGAEANAKLVLWKEKLDLLFEDTKGFLRNLKDPHVTLLDDGTNQRRSVTLGKDVFDPLFKSIEAAKKKDMRIIYCFQIIGRYTEGIIKHNQSQLIKTNFHITRLEPTFAVGLWHNFL